MPKLKILFVTDEEGTEYLVPEPSAFNARRFSYEEEIRAMDALEAQYTNGHDPAEKEERAGVPSGRRTRRGRSAGPKVSAEEMQSLFLRRAIARQNLALLDQQLDTFRQFKEKVDPKAVREVVYEFHPYTAGERGEARQRATTILEGGKQDFNPDTWNAEIVDACVDNLQQHHRDQDAEDLPYLLVTVLADRITSVSEPGLNEVNFTLSSRQISAMERKSASNA